MKTINDRRTDQEKKDTLGFMVATDRFLSGWGQAPRRSIYALAITDIGQFHIVEENLKDRGDMMRVRFCKKLPRMKEGDHLSIAGPSKAGRHYVKYGFAKGCED